MKKVIITEAGGGIGKEFTKLFLADGHSVLAVSLVDEELQALTTELADHGGKLETLQRDLSTADAAQSLLSWCSEHDWIPDTVVNNAGFACFGDSVDLAPERVASMIALNVNTVTTMSMLFGRVMRERGHGAILNVGSTAGMVPAVRLAAYCATKSYVNTFSYALAAELKPYGVTVTCLTPGVTQTNFGKAGGFHEFADKSMLKNMFEAGKAGSPAGVAQAGYKALARGKRQALTGKGALAAAVLSRLVAQRHLPSLMKNS